MSLHRNNVFRFWFRLATLVVLTLPSCSLNTDGILLLSFKYSLLNDPLSVLGNWNYEDETPCSWTGVTCTQLGSPQDFQVTGLALPNSQLRGLISPDIGSINHLRHLDLSNNFFNGSLPLSLFNASELQLLSLGNNGISGELSESIGALRNLQLLNLSNNAFTGNVPGKLTTITNLTTLSLSSNFFTGIVPSGFQSVRTLDLSSNLLNGSMPLDFFDVNLQYLNLSHNKFSGKIPPSFGKGIPENASIDISFNFLTGAIPESLVLLNQKKEAFAGNPDLCGKPLMNLCSITSTLSTPPNLTSSSSTTPAIAAIPITINSNPITNSQGTQTTTKQHGGLKPSTIAGIIIGDLAGMGIIAIIGIYVYQLKKKKLNAIKSPTMKKPENTYINNNKNLKNQSPASPESKHLSILSCLPIKFITEASSITNTSSNSSSDDERHPQQNQQQQKIKNENTNVPENQNKRGSIVIVDGETELELETLLKASAYVLGTSETSIVYKAVLEDGTCFAVRRIGEKCIEKLKDFENQVKNVAKLKHENLVRIRGFYWGLNEKLVISDFVNNGNLANAGKSGSSPCHLHLKVRLRIARGVAKGLAYIHEKKYVHGNIKPSNILLNSNMEPFISDLGLDHLVQRSTMHELESSTQQYGNIRSATSSDSLQEPAVSTSNPYIVISGSSMGITNPYYAPELVKNHRQSSKGDVYSYGIILLELLTGKAYLDRQMAQWTESGTEDKNRVLRLADVAIRAEVEEMKEAMLACFKLGFGCVSLVPRKRPSMKEALRVLEKIPLN